MNEKLVQPVVKASNTFGLALYQAAVKDADGRGKSAEDGNVFMSPYSISVALAMTAEGAREETLAEMASVLGYPESVLEAARRHGGLASESQTGPNGALNSIHAGNGELARYFAAASGDDDPGTRKAIQDLREKLRGANFAVEAKEKLSDWQGARSAQVEARKIADELNQLLTTVDRYDLRIANALWLEKTFALQPSYVQAIEQSYGKGLLTSLDFRSQTEASRLRINGWVEDRTANRIKDLIPAGQLPPETSLVITNAVYFLGQWSEPFKREMTRKEDFTLASGEKSKVQMMQDPFRDSIGYAAFDGKGQYFDTPLKVPADEAKRPPVYPGDDGFQILSLPYKGGSLEMMIILPLSNSGMAELESKLSAENLNQWTSRMVNRTVNVKMPRFRLEGSYKVGKMLQELGMKRAFVSPDQANGAQFYGMTESREASKSLYIGEVLHKAFVDVTEEGTEAAAATAVVMVAGAAAPRIEMVPFTPNFHADRPFIFAIRDSKSGLVLFIGRMMHPNQ